MCSCRVLHSGSFRKHCKTKRDRCILWIFIQSSRVHSLQKFNNFICIHWTRSTFKGKVCKDDFQLRWMSISFGPLIQSRSKKYDRWFAPLILLTTLWIFGSWRFSIYQFYKLGKLQINWSHKNKETLTYSKRDTPKNKTLGAKRNRNLQWEKESSSTTAISLLL